MSVDTQRLIRSFAVPETVERAATDSLIGAIIGPSHPFSENIDRLVRRSELLEHRAIRFYERADADRSDEEARSQSIDTFSSAFDCLVSAAIRRQPIISLDFAHLGQEINIGLRIAVTGLASGRIADVRAQLANLLPSAENTPLPGSDTPWDVHVANSIALALVWLVRKGDGWADIDAALSILRRLRSLQDDYEEAYLDSSSGVPAALDLVAYYHIAQVATLTAEYLSRGEDSHPGLVASIDRHRDQALQAAEDSNNGEVRHFANLVWVACRELSNNAIWTHALGLSDRVSELARSLADRARRVPVLDLWPSQQRALAANMLDPYRRAVLVEMPTSAGKTLLAKFSIMQSKNLHESGTIAYIVPTRALVNQVVVDLRSDLGPLGLKIEAAVPVFELDPTEDLLLQDAPDVLVTTPEKLDLLLRRNHPCTHDLSMVIVDEAHNLGDGKRGGRLELVLATVRRDRPSVRFLLLSPFLPAADDLVAWLGDGRELPPITINWKPGRRVVGVVEISGRGKDRRLQIAALEASANSDLPAGQVIPLGEAPKGPRSIKKITRAAASALRERGNTLIICWGPKSAMHRAAEISEGLEERPQSDLLAAICAYLDVELGPDNMLSKYLLRGVAYHHSGLPHEARWLIERLVQRGEIHTICGTTTLAQGVNFPISNVLIEDRRKGRGGNLRYSDLWNIAGRAGRALMDDVGVVAFPVAKQEQRDNWQRFLRDEAVAISSQLAEIVSRADEIGETFNLDMVDRIPELGDLLQFLAHAMRVGGYDQTADNVEDLLRSSLVYQQSRRSDRQASAKLIRLCRAYLEQISGRPGIAALSDQTGFSSPTINKWLRVEQEQRTLQSEQDWDPSSLFSGDLSALTQRVRAVADVPEMELGSEYAGTFDARRVAQIVRGWVNGDSVPSLADRFGDPQKSGEDRLTDFSSYLHGRLLGQISWGLGGLATVCLGGERRPTDQAIPEMSRYVPSMVFFGVRTQPAIWLRMAGVPRLVAPRLGTLWTQRQGGAPASLSAVRDWVSSLDDSAWGDAIPSGQISAEGMRAIWHELAAN